MCKIIITLAIFFSTCWKLDAQVPEKEAEFKKNLSEMYNRTSKTAKLIREQITQNQHAPFLADLYLELAEVLSQKANVIYYIKMEKENLSETTTVATKAMDDVVEAQKEAISIYEKILKEFPSFDKKSRTLYMLALSLKSIDEIPRFIAVAKQLLAKYPNEKEAMRVQLLLGDHFFTIGKLAEAQTYYLPLINTSYEYERNLARYKVGLIYIIAEKHREALDILEKLITDEELKETDNQFQVSLKQKQVKSNLKREALIDSIRAFTNVFKVNPDPPCLSEHGTPAWEIKTFSTMNKLQAGTVLA